LSEKLPLFVRESSLAPLKPEIKRRVASVIDRGAYIQGEEVAAFEQEFANYLGREHCVGVANGTDALMIGLIALGVRPGDEVVVPAVTFFATAEAVAAIGAKPVFADVELGTWTISKRTVEPLLTDSTAAIVPVHLFGNPAPMNELMSLADASGVPVLEDAAQAAGATYDGKMAGAIGSAASFSFYPGKNLGAIGDAGALVTDDPEVADLARKLREHGSADRKIHTEVGFNSRLDSIQAAALSVFLPQLDAWTKSRRQAADAYGNSSLAGLVGLPVETAQAQSCHHLYVISSDRRDEILMALSAAEIESRVYYSPAIPFQPAMKAFAPDHQLPGATAYENSALALPMGESLSVEDAQRVAAVISSALS
jgi:dTDP-4-amino-4,6-dideoxygalactose transaminase